MKKIITTLFLLLGLSSYAQNNLQAMIKNFKVTPQMIEMAWNGISPKILDKINDPLAKEIISKSVPKILNHDVNGAKDEIIAAISRVKNIKVLNKEYLAQLENNINDIIKSVQQKDIISALTIAANGLANVGTVTDSYIKNGTLDKPEANTPPVIASDNAKAPDLISNSDVQSKLHLDKNNKYLFYLPNGKIKDTTAVNKDVAAEEFSVSLDNGKKFNMTVAETSKPELKDASVEAIEADKDASEKFRGMLSTSLFQGKGQFINSEVATYPNLKTLKYTFLYNDKHAVSSMANVLVAFNNSTMFMIVFSTPANDFPETTKSFDELMKTFFLIGVDKVSHANSMNEASNKKPCEENRTGSIVIQNNSNNPYDIYIDGVYKIRIAGRGISEGLAINEGDNHKLYAKQVSGFAMYPTEKTKYLNCIRCSSYNWQIP
jgi:hypothetical protein